MKDIFKNIFGPANQDDGFVDYEEGYDTSSSAVTEEEAYESNYNPYPTPKAAINLHSNTHQPRITIMIPTSCDDVMTEGIERLREGTIIFLNLTRISKEEGTRIVDFMTGAAAMCDGKIKKVDETCCYAVAPKNVEWVDMIQD